MDHQLSLFHHNHEAQVWDSLKQEVLLWQLSLFHIIKMCVDDSICSLFLILTQ